MIEPQTSNRSMHVAYDDRPPERAPATADEMMRRELPREADAPDGMDPRRARPEREETPALGIPYPTTLRCPRCRKVSAGARRFCGNCGHTLWETCYRCGTLNLAEEKFCGACGADQVSGLQEQVELCEDALAQGQKLYADCQFDELTELLAPIARLENSRLAQFAQSAAELIEQAKADRERWAEQIAGAEQAARQYLANYDYREAIAQLERIPPALRSEAIWQLHKEATEPLAEVQSLDQELRHSVNGTLSLPLLEKVGRLLSLKPDHTLGLELAERFRDRLSRVAKEKLAKHQYEEVRTFLGRLPPSLRTEEVETLRERASDLVWLSQDLRTAPVVDKGLVGLAGRMRQLAPSDAESVRLIDELFRRARLARERQLPAVPWVGVKQTALGIPVDWLVGMPRISFDPSVDARAWLENPGRLAVACGLALQGLGIASLDTNLLPNDRSILDRMSQLMRKREAETAWGLDLGSSALKAVRLAWRGEAQGVVLDACDVVEHRKLLSHAANDDEERTLIEETLAKFTAQNNASADRLCLGLPARMVWLHTVSMPAWDRAKIAAALPFELRSAVPVPLDELAWDFGVMGTTGDSGGPRREQDVVVQGAKRLPLKDRLARFRAAKLPIDIVQSDCVALYNFYAHNFLAQGAEAIDRPAALVDIGGDSTSILIASPESLWTRHVGMGSEQVNRALVRAFQLTFAQAEEWKRNPAAAPSVARFYDAIEPVLKDFFREVEGAIQAFASTPAGAPVGRVFALGGGLQFHGLLRYLQAQTVGLPPPAGLQGD